MPRPRAPISTRLRNRDKTGVGISTPQTSEGNFKLLHWDLFETNDISRA